MADFYNTHQLTIWLVIIWTLPWKGLALWKSAQDEKKWWFIAILVFNTLAILEIVYIFGFSKKKWNLFK